MIVHIERLEVTLSRYTQGLPGLKRDTYQFAKVFSNDVLQYNVKFSEQIYNNPLIFYLKREYLLKDVIKRLNQSQIKTQNFQIIVDPSFFEPENRDLGETIREEFNKFGRDNKISVTYEGLD